ncbi:ROK family protein [Rhizobium sp. KVB221]|uniref:ROK family protein n=1 Tax=Rhizobium setariae TaxID=2801340 RepID=A0A936YU77_9HYPH|nr:ROK family protein [Rhizobium setariae]MBL0374644.1 ROK family protein [Rhizobium setariae]
MSRTDLSAVTGLSASTVTVITNSLLERGALVAHSIGETTSQRRGRPQVRLSPNPAHATVAVIVLGLNTIQATVADYAGNALGSLFERTPTKHLDAESFNNAITSTLKRLLDMQEPGFGPLSGIIVGTEGIVDIDGNTLLSSPATDATDVPLGPALEAAFGVHVEVYNESNMIAEALHWKAPARYGSDFATVLLSTGVGMGLYLNGKLFSGVRTSAVEFGHVCHEPNGALCRCGRRGCIEAYAGGYGIWRAAHGEDPLSVTEDDPEDTAMAELAARARAGDGPERQAFRAAGKAIGTGLRNLFTIFDPIPLVFAGQGAAVLDLMMESLEEAMTKPVFGLPVTVSVIDSYLDYRALIREGGLMRGLVYLDQTMPAVGDVREKVLA